MGLKCRYNQQAGAPRTQRATDSFHKAHIIGMASANYTAKDITVLEGLEPVRKRPGMYIGGVGSAGLHHLVWEIFDNSVDEAMNGHASNIWVTLHDDGSSITISDDGRGIPIDKHPTTKKSALEVIFTVLHAGGKFEHGNYKTAGGLHGVGASVVNALSKELVATVKRDGAMWEMRFKQGKPVAALKKIGPARGTGTTVYFHPDAAIFPKIEFDPDVIKERLEVASYLHKGVKVSFENEGTKERRTFEHSEGLVDYLKKIVAERGAKAVHDAPFVLARDEGMLLGVDTVFVKNPLPAVKLSKIDGLPKTPGNLTGSGSRFVFEYRGPDTAIAINRLLKDGAKVSFDGPSRVAVNGASRAKLESLAHEFGLDIGARVDGRNESRSDSRSSTSDARPAANDSRHLHMPRVAMYQPYTGGNMDEGWTRWVLEQYEFNLTSIHNEDIRAGRLRQKFDAIILADQDVRGIVDGYDAATIRPEYRGGIGEPGIESLRQFVADGGTLVTMGAACDLAIEKFPIAVHNIKKSLTRDQHFAPGAILRIEVDTQHPLGYGMDDNAHGFYINSPFFSIVEGFSSQKTTVVARYPNTGVVASGWLKGEELMAGRAAVVSIEMNPGRVILFGLGPQHRAQTHATFPMLFNALYLSATDGRTE